MKKRNPKTNSRHYGIKMEEDVLLAIEEMYYKYPHETFINIARLAKIKNSLPVPITTMRRWWKKYETTGLFPHEQREINKKIKKLTKKYKRTSVITDDVVEALKDIVDEHPEFR